MPANHLPETEQLKYCGDELDVLKGLIDYAEKMIAEDGGDSAYSRLRRHAYGKTVVIDTEKKGRLVFRLSSTALTYPNSASGYATPHSPVGRLCGYLRPGDEDESPAWGEYRVTETRLFDRFDGLQFNENVCNFLRMVVEGDGGNATVSELLRTLRQGMSRTTALLTPADTDAHLTEGALMTKPAPEVTSPPPAPLPVEFGHIEVEDEQETESAAGELIDDADDVEYEPVESVEEYFGLSEIFYVNRTREQDQVVARSPIGAMFVEGIAGSGKTSAALGRTKMLCDFNESVVTEEAEFREIAGQALEHWSGRFAGKFSQEGSIGFVRTGELIQYLKETCRRIDLPNLPVAEFKELQVRLRQHRKIERSHVPGWRWSMQPEPRGSEIDTTMPWLFAADRAISTIIAERLSASMPQSRELAAIYVEVARQRAVPVLECALKFVRESLVATQNDLRHKPKSGRFGLDRLAESVSRSIREVRSKVLGATVLWFIDGDQALFATNESAMASLLVRRKQPLYLRNASRLVVLDNEGLVDRSLVLLTENRSTVEWSAEARQQLTDGKLAVQDPTGQVLRAVAVNAEDLFMRLLPEAIDKPYVLHGGKLKPLKLIRGLGRMKLELLKPLIDEPDEDQGGDPDDETEGHTVQAVDPRHRSIDAALRSALQKSLMQPLAYLADHYMAALGATPDSFPAPDLAKKIHTQMQSKKLSDEDIDLLLCLAHLVGRGFQGNPAQLRAPLYYQSVFIDEVQDFTEQQVFLMAEQARPEYKAVTAVGDIAQKLHHGNRIDIASCFPHQQLDHVRLTENLRQLDAPRIAWFSTCFRAELQDGLAGEYPHESLLERLNATAPSDKGPELLLWDDEGDLDTLIVDILARIPGNQTAAVILPRRELAEASHRRLRAELASRFVESEFSEKVDLARRHVRHFIPVTNAKGLEFDTVVLPHLEAYDLDDRSHINRLYVGLTRARKRLVLLAPRAQQSTRLDLVWQRYRSGIETT